MADVPTFDLFDKLLGSLHGLPDITAAKPSTVQAISPLLGCTQMFIVQTYRQKDSGDTIFLQAVSKEGTVRLALPPSVADAIARQRDALTGKSRSRAAKENMKQRMERGEGKHEAAHGARRSAWVPQGRQKIGGAEVSAAHTPAPWTLDYYPAANRDQCARVLAHPPEGQTVIADLCFVVEPWEKANAALVVAAPDLLEALYGVARETQSEVSGGCWCSPEYKANNTDGLHGDACAFARAAIRKAVHGSATSEPRGPGAEVKPHGL